MSEKDPGLSPLQKLYRPAHELIDQALEAEHAGDTVLAAQLREQADVAFREAHSRNPLLRQYVETQDITE